MLVFAQGTVGLGDLFIHPAYTSSVTPLNLDPEGFALIVILVSTFLLAWAFYMYFHYRDKRKLGDMLDGMNPRPP